MNSPTFTSEDVHHLAHLTKQNRIKVLWSLAVSAFWAVFLWGFWDKGVLALGLNAFVFWAALAGLFLWSLRHKGINLAEHLFWIAPIGLIIASYALYDNPFLKLTSLLLLPVLFALFYNFAHVPEPRRIRWDLAFLAIAAARTLSLLNGLRESALTHARLFALPKKGHDKLARIGLGLAFFAVIALTVVIPMLSYADAEFAARMGGLLAWFREIISTSFVYKTIFALACSIAFLAALMEWSKTFAYANKENENEPLDPIISGIVLAGILGLYLLFLWIQAKRLWVGSLPFEFSAVTLLVKSGFWQLLLLSIINIAIYFLTYRKTIPAVQHILAAFTAASLLLLASAAQRMGLYVTYYGFSYEKFFASYTVIFCAILFVWLISRLFVRRRADIMKFLVVLFLWMYGLLTVLPVEQFILRANVALAGREGSQIRLVELTMLSPDVLALAQRYEAEGLLAERTTARFAREVLLDVKNAQLNESAAAIWTDWIENRQLKLKQKKWYEKNAMNFLSGY